MVDEVFFLAEAPHPSVLRLPLDVCKANLTVAYTMLSCRRMLFLPPGRYLDKILPYIFTNCKIGDIIIVPNNLNIHSYRFFSLWNNYSFFRYTIKQTRFGKNAAPA